MPFINGRFHINPAYGRAIERARAAESDADHPEFGSTDAHWVTINHRHVLIRQQPSEHITQRPASIHQVAKAPPNSRADVVLIPAGSGKPLASVDMNGFWTFSWEPRELTHNELELPGSKYSDVKVELTESVNGGPFRAAGSQNGGFRDIISPETRTIVQRFSIGGRRVQVVLGRESNGRLIKAWDVRVTVKYPHAPAYSPGF